jgi:hypothetical protein
VAVHWPSRTGTGADVWQTVSTSGSIGLREFAAWCRLEERVEDILRFVDLHLWGPEHPREKKNSTNQDVCLNNYHAFFLLCIMMIELLLQGVSVSPRPGKEGEGYVGINTRAFLRVIDPQSFPCLLHRGGVRIPLSSLPIDMHTFERLARRVALILLDNCCC